MQNIYNFDFTKSFPQFKVFDSFNYQLNDNGLILTSYLDDDTGASQPARFRAFGIPLSINEYATSRIKVPSNVNGNGLDFSFWYFNTLHKYGYSNNLQGSNFDDNEFDVDEIHNNKHYMTLYAWNQGNTFKQTPCSNGFCSEFHDFAIKWTNSSITYYIDNQPFFQKNIHINEKSMFPTWEIETPQDGLSSGWGGSVNPSDFPSQAIIKNYKVYKL